HRDLFHQVVADPASAAGLLGGRQFPGGLVSRIRLEHAGDGADRHSLHRRPPAPGRIPTRNRFPAPHGARPLTETLCTHYFFCNLSTTSSARKSAFSTATSSLATA